MKDEDLKNWLEGKASSKEVKDKSNSDDFNELENIVSQSSRMKVPDGKSKDQAWNEFLGKIKPEEQPKAKHIKWMPYTLMAAASVVVLMVTYIFFIATEDISTNNGEHLSHTLPDGSVIRLNADTKIAYNTFLWSSRRTLHLDGEAYFEVAEGSKFTVDMNDAQVEVIGTSFNIFYRNDELEVTCFSGKVKVINQSEELILGVEERYDSQLGKTEFTTEQSSLNQPSWITGDFYFSNTSIGNVLTEIERQFGIEIVYTGKEERKYTGYFNNKNLDEALNLVLRPMNLTYTKDTANKIIVE